MRLIQQFAQSLRVFPEFPSKLEGGGDDNDSADFNVQDTGRLTAAGTGNTTEIRPMLAMRLRLVRSMVCAVGLVAVACTGCQVDVGGQTLPSPYYLKDDIQYFPAGPRMKLSREAAAMKAFKEEEALRATRPPQP
jgi:hypothetical protein